MTVTIDRVLLRRLPLCSELVRARQYLLIPGWRRSGRVGPPPHPIKTGIVQDYARRYGISTLVETGTYFGDMVAANVRTFRRIYSIELNERLWRFASRRFRREGHVTVLLGDSTDVLPRLLPQLAGPALFWLDGHYSAGVTSHGELASPVVSELRTILSRPEAGHVILIDDARGFVGSGGYPTLDDLRQRVSALAPGTHMLVEDDVIRLTPPPEVVRVGR